MLFATRVQGDLESPDLHRVFETPEFQENSYRITLNFFVGRVW
jgi:hypothetical protein